MIGGGLAALLDASARARPRCEAVSEPGGRRVTYAELAELSDRLRDRFWQLGVRPGDRVGVRLHKSIDSVATIFGALKAGAAYVPVDADSPASRAAFILNDCGVKVVVTEQALESALTGELSQLGSSPRVLALDTRGPEIGLRALLDAEQGRDAAPSVQPVLPQADDIAYILYTSGSTGKPKGVVLSQGNAKSFVDWCSTTFQPVPDDTFSSHAPFHFDLSILDVFVSLKHGARLVLFGEELGKEPVRLAATVSSERISIWYSTPSILNLLTHYGRLERHDYSPLRIVLFAGEVFPVPQFRALRQVWRQPRYFNLYGPTETNVCTCYEVPTDGSWEGAATFPIGTMCEPNRGMVVDEGGAAVAPGQPGELVVCGPNVMIGYWNLPELNDRAFLIDADGKRWYRTGDIVTVDPAGQYSYVGRRDRMVKRRGYRVELGEIEAALLRHPDIREAAVVSVPNVETGVRIAAFVTCRNARALSVIDLKRVSSQNLPPYMIPDVFTVLGALPRTSTDKVDLQALRARVS
jgi:amino acid adenylation domain-containing protein